MYRKAGVSLLEPVAILDKGQSYVGLNLDKGSQSEGGSDLQVVSNIEMVSRRRTTRRICTSSERTTSRLWCVRIDEARGGSPLALNRRTKDARESTTTK